MSILKVDKWVNSAGNEYYPCRAWVNFNGTGTVAIRASGNVSSIVDNGVGDYTINFTNPMPDANYSISGSATLSSTNGYPRIMSAGGTDNVLTTSARVRTANDAGTFEDCVLVCVAIFR